MRKRRVCPCPDAMLLPVIVVMTIFPTGAPQIGAGLIERGYPVNHAGRSNAGRGAGAARRISLRD
jgi:hypothetical protein